VMKRNPDTIEEDKIKEKVRMIKKIKDYSKKSVNFSDTDHLMVLKQATSKIIKFKANIMEAKANIMEVKANIMEAKANITVAKANITEVKANITEAKANITEVKANITVVKANIIKAETLTLMSQQPLTGEPKVLLLK